MRRGTALAIVCATALALGAGAYVAADIADRAPGVLTSSEAPMPAPPPGFAPQTPQSLPVPVAPAGEEPSADAVAALWGPVAQAATDGKWTTWGTVVDAETGDVLLDASAQQAHTPASTTKILASFAALSTLDPTATLTTSVEAQGARLRLASQGDMLLAAGESDPDEVNGRAGLATLAERTAAALRESGTTSVTVDWAGDLFDGPNRLAAWTVQGAGNYEGAVGAMAIDAGRTAPDAYAFVDDPEGVAASAFVAALNAQGLSAVLGSETPSLDGATSIASVESAPLAEQIRWMLHNSDNTLADQYCRLTARALGVEASYGGSVSAMRSALEKAGVPTTGLSLGDCSGLSSEDRIAPATLVGAIRASLTAKGALAELPRSLPWAGVDGTMEHRMTGGAALGNAQAKTGSLAAVSSLAGIVQTSSGRLLVFAVGNDSVPEDAAALTRPFLDAFITGLAGL